MGNLEYPGGELEAFAGAVTWKAYFASHLRPHIGSRVLEVGAGIGGSTALLCGPGVQSWLCLDPDPGHVRRLNGKIASGELPPVCRAVCGTLADLETGLRLDTILYIDVLEHIQDDLGEIKRAAALLPQAGTIAVLAPAHPFLTTEFDRAVGHFRRYTKAMLKALRPEGFRLRNLAYLDSAGTLLSLGNRMLLRQAMPTATQIRFWDRVVVPVSRVADPLLNFSVGKSILAVWEKP